MRIEFYQPAGEHEQYAPHAFDRLIGQDAPFKIAGTERGRAAVIAVKVDEDGRGATWTVDITGGDERQVAEAAAGRFSFAARISDADPGFRDPLSVKLPLIRRNDP